ncbi:hypothetical protein SH501x_001680 [Pirellulaceae bacterium SH501]
MNPQTLLRSLSARLSIPIPSSEFKPDGFPTSQFPFEVFDGGGWRAFLVQDWYLLGKTSLWSHSGSGAPEPTVDIQWRSISSPEPNTHSLSIGHGSDCKPKQPSEILAWQGSLKVAFPKDRAENDLFCLAMHIPKHRPIVHLLKHWGTPPRSLQSAWETLANNGSVGLDSIWLLTDLSGRPFRIDEWIAAATNVNAGIDTIADQVACHDRSGPVSDATLDPGFTTKLHHRETKTKSTPDAKNKTKKKRDRSRKRTSLLALSIVSPCLLLAIVVALGQWQSTRTLAPEPSSTPRGTPNGNADPVELSDHREFKEDRAVKEIGNVKPDPAESDRLTNDTGSAVIAEDESPAGILSESSTLFISPDLQALSSPNASSLSSQEPPSVAGISLVPMSSLETGSSLLSDLADQGTKATNDEAEPLGSAAAAAEKANRDSDSAIDTTESMSSGVQRSFVIRGGTERHRIGTGVAVIANQATCQASLRLEDLSDRGVTLTPTEQCMLSGNSAQQWVIALEDESPELVIELVSKPARRWELWINTGVREHRTAPIFLLQSDRAARSVEHIVSVAHWSQAERERLQIAIDSGNTRGPNSPWQRQRSLQRLEKELERSLEAWKVIERLSLLVFDHAKLEILLKTP